MRGITPAFLRCLKRSCTLGPLDPVADLLFVGRLAVADDALALRRFCERLNNLPKIVWSHVRQLRRFRDSTSGEDLCVMSAELRNTTRQCRLVYPLLHGVGIDTAVVQLLCNRAGTSRQ